jgi:steroid delta-isomerase-like uncharacterized protein
LKQKLKNIRRKIMAIKENKEYALQLAKAWNETAGDAAKILSLYDNYYAPGYILHHLSRGDMNRAQTIQYIIAVASAFPDYNFAVDDMVAEGDMVATRYTIRSTHKGTFMGIPATGKQIVMKGVEIRRIVGGKTLECWDFPDTLGMMTQLGVIPSVKPKT